MASCFSPAGSNRVLRAIGIDPGSRFTGFGVVESEGPRLRLIAGGTIRMPPSQPFPNRLKMIYEQLLTIIERDRPSLMAVEEVFFAKNVKSALQLGQARGAAVLAGVNSGLELYEYSALRIKQAVVGYGRAGKEQVAMMVQQLFRLNEPPEANAADAMAVAICHLNTCLLESRLKGRSTV